MEDLKIFNYNGNDQSLIKATDLANKIFEELIERLREVNRRIMTSKKGVYHKYFTTRKLADQIQFLVYVKEIRMEVKTYYYRNPGVLGYFSSSKPNQINLNRNSFPRDVESIVATFYHELIHKIDTLLEVDLGHGKGWFRNRYRLWKEECAPFLVDGEAESIAMKHTGKDIMSRTDNTRYKTVPLWKRILFFWKY